MNNMKQALLVVLVCMVQIVVLCLAETSSNDCKNDPKKAADDFDKQIKEWFDYMVPYRTNLEIQVNKKYQEMQKNPKCIAKYYDTYSVHDYVLLSLIPVCGIVPVRHNQSPWRKNPNASGEEICNFLEVQGAIALRNANYNRKVLPKCPIYEWFVRIFYESWKECNEKCENGSY